MTFRFLLNSGISLGLLFWVWGFDEILIGCMSCMVEPKLCGTDRLVLHIKAGIAQILYIQSVGYSAQVNVSFSSPLIVIETSLNSVV